MGIKRLFSGLIVFILILMLIFYWFIPFEKIEFVLEGESSNFSLYSIGEDMQFYSNMRFPNRDISYKIYDCTLKKQEDMNLAFDIIEDETSLSFFPVFDKEDISVNCNDKNKMEEGMFIAGEGGPTNIIQNKNFNIISKGSIILIKDSNCPKPNIALHELLHVLGFNHSNNENNIMYYITDCKQTLGDIPEVINKIYSIKNISDLEIENLSAIMNGKYLDSNISIRNNGLVSSDKFNLKIYSEDTEIKNIEIDSIKAGEGIEISLTNVWVSKLNIKELMFLIDSDFEELDKENNKKILQIKEN
ncbi:MAG: M12 family metallopeptidase [Candidatus Pacearchaeota archaeon]|nr:M12 family metallopeptidase [Candidatus Pacearchaeota archaeon]